VLKDFGAKSIVFPDSSLYGSAIVTAGDSGVVTIEMVNVLRLWRGSNPDSLPRTVVLRNTNEGLLVGEIEAFGAGAGIPRAPRLHITYVRPVQFGVP
jgi:hypothetical protein